MDKIRTKEAAEATLRELPSVIGAFVREDIYGHPREVHLLIQPGPNVRHLARDVRDLLEERLKVPIDQRIISIAQVVRNPGDSPLEEVAELTADPEAAPSLPQANSAVRPPRVVFAGMEAITRDARVVVRIRVKLGDREFVGEGSELDVGMGRVRAAASAALHAASAATAESLQLELDGASVIRAFERDYVLVAALATAPELGRRPLALTGAHTGESDDAATAALAALKAVNRVVGYRLRSLERPPAI
jgi:hypothetical protein